MLSYRNKNAICILMLILSALCMFPLYARTGLLSGEKNIRITRTEFFDIIFPQSREESARLLAQNADGIYREVCEDYGIVPRFRMPVVITTATDMYNAYFSNAWYNHIVMFDTMPEPDMSVFSDTFLGTFRHELTHAVTINMRSEKLMEFHDHTGDVLNFGDYIVMTGFMKEGASVAQESKSGEGRLHDGFYLHMIRQSKLQKTFPSYVDVTGSRDIYPSGSMMYGFGGPFTEYIQKKYGMRKYAEFWYKAVNFGALTYSTCFKKTYGVSIKKNGSHSKNLSMFQTFPQTRLRSRMFHCQNSILRKKVCTGSTQFLQVRMELRLLSDRQVMCTLFRMSHAKNPKNFFHHRILWRFRFLETENFLLQISWTRIIPHTNILQESLRLIQANG